MSRSQTKSHSRRSQGSRLVFCICMDSSCTVHMNVLLVQYRTTLSVYDKLLKPCEVLAFMLWLSFS